MASRSTCGSERFDIAVTAREGFDKIIKILGGGLSNKSVLAGYRMLESQHRGMQGLPAERERNVARALSFNRLALVLKPAP